MLQDLAQRAQRSGLNAEYFEKNRDKILEDSEKGALRQVRFWYLVDAIAKAEGIEAEEGKLGSAVVKFILENAK